MDLWIRSQDKEQLIKVDNVRVKHEYEQKKVNDNYGRTCAYINGKYNCSYVYTDSSWLGEFKTKERALEVLNEIQEYIQKQGQSYILTDEKGLPAGLKEYGNIYEMPEK